MPRARGEVLEETGAVDKVPVAAIAIRRLNLLLRVMAVVVAIRIGSVNRCILYML